MPFHLLGGGPYPESSKLSDSGQTPVSSIPTIISLSTVVLSAFSGKPKKSHDLDVWSCFFPFGNTETTPSMSECYQQPSKNTKSQKTTHTHTHTYVYIHAYAHTYIGMYVQTYVGMYIYIRRYIHVCTYVYIRMYVHSYLPTYIHVYNINYMFFHPLASLSFSSSVSFATKPLKLRM